MPLSSVPLAAPQRNRPPGGGSGTRAALCMEHKARLRARCKSLWTGINRCYHAGHEGTTTPQRARDVPQPNLGLHLTRRRRAPRPKPSRARRPRRRVAPPNTPAPRL